jgi:hypothetical protein
MEAMNDKCTRRTMSRLRINSIQQVFLQQCSLRNERIFSALHYSMFQKMSPQRMGKLCSEFAAGRELTRNCYKVAVRPTGPVHLTATLLQGLFALLTSIEGERYCRSGGQIDAGCWVATAGRLRRASRGAHSIDNFSLLKVAASCRPPFSPHLQPTSVPFISVLVYCGNRRHDKFSRGTQGESENWCMVRLGKGSGWRFARIIWMEVEDSRAVHWQRVEQPWHRDR